MPKAHIDVVGGFEITGTDVRRASAEYNDETVVVDRNLVSCPSPAVSGPWTEADLDLPK